jgi:hypothetical protein
MADNSTCKAADQETRTRPMSNCQGIQQTGQRTRHLAIFITTRTGEESSKLRDDPSLYKQLCDAMLRAGYPPAAVPFVKFRVESQETVDRDYGGSDPK